MTFRYVGNAAGRQVYVRAPGDSQDVAPPAGYSIAAVVLKDGWTSDEVGWVLNGLYGALTDWTAFDPHAGARSFVFYGERAEEASNLCDTFAFAWSKGAEQQYDDVMAASNDAGSIEDFVEAMFAGEIAVSDAYAGKMQNVLFTVVTGDRPTDDDRALLDRVTNAVEASARQHGFD